MNDLNNMFK